MSLDHHLASGLHKQNLWRIPAGGADSSLSALNLLNLVGMKVIGLLMMPAGWFIVLAAVALLRLLSAQEVFVAAGCAVEILGLVLIIRSPAGVKGESE